MSRKIDPIQRGGGPSPSHGISGKNKKQKQFSLVEYNTRSIFFSSQIGLSLLLPIPLFFFAESRYVGETKS